MESDSSFSEVFSMADLFPLSVILHFPSEVYLSRGVGDLCPLLVRALLASKISALQFLRGGRVRVTFREPAFREELLSNDLFFEDRLIPVTPAGVHVVTVYVRDLPVELSNDSVKSACSTYGEVYSVRHGFFKDFPDLQNGNRLILMSISNSIPSLLNVLGFVCRAWHPGQPVYCTICKESGHPPRTCPLSGLCRRCKQPGHVARECRQGRGQPRPSSVAPVDPAPVPDPVPDPATGSEDDGDLSSVSSDQPDPVSLPPVLPPSPSPDQFANMSSSDLIQVIEKRLSTMRNLKDSPLTQIVQSLVTSFSIPQRLIEFTVDCTSDYLRKNGLPVRVPAKYLRSKK